MTEESTPPTPHDEEQAFTLTGANALMPLLILFAVTVLVILVVIVRAKPFEPPEGAVADHAFAPEDFPERWTKSDALLDVKGLAQSGEGLFPVPAPPFSEGLFPCSDCHDADTANTERRELTEAHEDIKLHHDEEHRWCLDCHDAVDRDNLRLASGEKVPFTESYRLCGQCHGTQYRDWKSGIHGKRTGYWDGPKRYLLCVHCHNPHSPHYMDLVPFPPPVRPQFLSHQNEASPRRGGGKEAPAGTEQGGEATHG